jgi:hypothetical protein
MTPEAAARARVKQCHGLGIQDGCLSQAGPQPCFGEPFVEDRQPAQGSWNFAAWSIQPLLAVGHQSTDA